VSGPTRRDPSAARLERKRLAEARDRARLAIAALAEHVTDKPATDRESHRYRGRLGWPAGSLRADLRAVEDYFDALDEACCSKDEGPGHGAV
jgi:hypothetical protein